MKLTENTLKRLVEEVVNEYGKADLGDSIRTDHINAIVGSLEGKTNEYEIEDAVKQYCAKKKINKDEKEKIMKNVKAKMKQK